jgi:hypothetical protein
MSEDRLSRLPDPVLWQVLSHAPAKEAVCTGALARPWRSLWLSSGVLNLDSRSYSADKLRCSRNLVFFRDANAALRILAAAEGSYLRKLTFTYLTPNNDEAAYWLRRKIDDRLNALFSGAPAVRGLEELRVHVSPPEWYSLRVAVLPSNALRALYLDGLLLTLPPDAHRPSFARLETLRLHLCVVRLTELQAIVDTAPLLASVELDHVHFSNELASSSAQRRLCCPRVTALSLAKLGGLHRGFELDAPSLRRFAYRGFPLPFTLMSRPPASVERADLHFYLNFVPASDRRKHDVCMLFWQFVGGFGGAKVLNVSFEQPGGRRRAEQIKELNLRMMKRF